jgi:DNA polymerase-3 subunit epsilon
MSLLKRLLPFLGPKPQLTQAQEARLAAWRALPTITARVPLERSRLVVVDVETSGLNINKDRLIAIGAVAVVNGRVALADSLEIVLQQRMVSGKDNILIHGIGGEVQREGAPPVEALLTFLEFVGKSPLVAFHTSFDQTMIGRAIKTYLGFRLDHQWTDLAYVAPTLYARLARSHRSLDHWMEYFRISNYARHSALADALSTAELLLTLRPRLKERGADSFSGLRDMEREWRLQTLPT